MAQQADGTVYIDTLMDTTGMKAGGKEVEAAVKRMVSTVSKIGGTAEIAMQKAGNAFIKQNQAVAQQEQKIDSLKRKLDELKNEKIPTDGYKLLDKELNSLNAELDKVKAKQKEWIDMGFPKSDVIAKTKKEYDAVANKIDAVKAKQKEMVNAGTAYTIPDTSATEQKLFYEQQRLQNMTNSLSTSYASLKNKVDSYGQSASNAAKKQSELTKENKKLERATKSADVSIGGFGKRLNKGVFTVLKYTIGIRSLYVLTRRLRTAITDGFKNLAQYSGVTNASISSVMSALTRLKNSLATAFAPILNVVAPILTKFINMLSNAVSYIGMFIAALTGQKTFTRAKAVQEDYAAILGNTSSAAKDVADSTKEAEKATNDYLSGLDEIRKWESPDKDYGSSGSGGSGGGGGGVSPQDMFEEVEIPSKLQDFAETLKKKFAEAAKEIKAGWDGAFQADTSQLLENIKEIAEANKAVWNSPEVRQAMSDFETQALRTLGAVVGSVASIATSFAVGVTGGIADAKKDLIEFDKLKLTSIFNNLTNLAKTTEDLADAASTIGEAFESEGFQKIVEILEKITDVTILDALDKITGFLSDLFDMLLDPFIQNANKLENVWENVFEIISITMSPIESFFDKQAKNSKSYKDSSLHEWFSGKGDTMANNAGKNLDYLNKRLETFRDILNGTTTTNIENIPIFGKILERSEALAWSFDKMAIEWDNLKNAAREKFGEIKNHITTAWDDVKNKSDEKWNAIKSKLSEDWETLKAAALGKFLTIKDTITNTWDNVKTISNGKWNEIKENLHERWVKIKENASQNFLLTKNAIATKWSDVKANTLNVWEDIKQKLSDVWTKISANVSEKFGDIKNKIKNIWDNIASVLKHCVNGIIGVINGMIKSVASGLNGIITSLNKLHFNIPSWVPGIGGKSFGFSIGKVYAPQIPYLATGAVIPPNAPFMAVLGDQKHGTNIEAPLSTIEQAVTNAMQKNGNGSQNMTIRIPLIIDGRQIFEAVLDEAKMKQMVSGRNPFEMA